LIIKEAEKQNKKLYSFREILALDRVKSLPRALLFPDSKGLIAIKT
jgi:hypothetical protein